jgi:hypothetical protein
MADNNVIPEKLKELQKLTEEVFNDEGLKSWLFSHTRTEEEFNNLRRALLSTKQFKPVVWSGRPGSRFYLPMEE